MIDLSGQIMSPEVQNPLESDPKSNTQVLSFECIMALQALKMLIAIFVDDLRSINCPPGRAPPQSERFQRQNELVVVGLIVGQLRSQKLGRQAHALPRIGHVFEFTHFLVQRRDRRQGLGIGAAAH